MIVTYNNYEEIDEPAAGASFYYYEISRLLNQNPYQGLKIIPHNFVDILKGKEELPKLSENDILLSNVGPYSWFYYHLREKMNAKFRIIHDVQTALYADHILQEILCNNYMRKGDSVLFLSEYQRQLYLRLFPEHLNESNTFVCNPLLKFMPPITKKKRQDKGLTLGWVGRVFDAKNFAQALEVFIDISREMRNSNVKFLVAGISEEKYSETNVKRMLKEREINPENYIHLNKGSFIRREDIWNILSKIDVLIFPSLGNMESLGRVVLEANHAGVKVIAANYGSMPELLPQENLVKVRYDNREISLTSTQTLGKVDVREMIEKCLNYKKLKLGSNDYYKYHDKKLFKIFSMEEKEEKRELNKDVKKFIDNIQINLNADFNMSKEVMIKKAISFLSEYIRKNKFDIVETSHKLCDYLNFKPSLFIRYKLEHDIFFEDCKIPKIVLIEPTRKCQCDCIMCYIRGHRNQKDIITLENVKKLITDMKKLGSKAISFVGGEPFLWEGILETIKFANKENIETIIFSNGQNIDKEYAKKILDAEPTYLFISIDATKPKLNDYIRGKKGAFERSIEAVKNLVQIKKEYKKKTLIGIATTIMGINLREIPEMLKLAKKLGVYIALKPVQIHLVDKNMNLFINRNIEYDKVWIKKSMYKLLDRIIDETDAYRDIIFDDMDYIKKIKDYFRNPINSKLGLICNSGDNSCAIESQGNVGACYGFFKSLGNIRDKSIIDIWFSPEFKKFREIMNKCQLPCYSAIYNSKRLPVTLASRGFM